MTTYAITPPPVPSLAIAGSSERFPLRRVFCVARNYAAHAREMGANPDREPPFFFTKPADAVVPAAGVVPYPSATNDMHHEVELVVAIGKPGVNVKPEDAMSLVWGYGVGLDLTRRDLQAAAKEAGRPWDMAKGFDASAPCSELHPVSAVGHPSQGRIWLEVNGALAQEGDLGDMIWRVPEVIAYLSGFVALQPGDLIYSGTPSGVGPLKPGDHVRGGVDGVAGFQLEIGAQP
ncbi:fumarylacetoacetate hydrolase family protein [Massilia terrae]|uniref:Fumarylacetoacetate hydrolase family protein n=1 Tax=Massilia terrae TaxID=1811224 RepID=A0ABT2CZ83_9BURK|nr:fumarylacetoacetate hydrolase family protein [Massilia terrae]MCS0659295.1 fumarylacetoacetate hydrolase family protein [Massilia terrae]